METKKICPKCSKELGTSRRKYCSNSCQRNAKSLRSYHKRSAKVSLWRQRLKIKAVAYKGGKCEVCSYSKCTRALKFHHKDPKTKSFAIGGKGCTRSWDRVKEELDKCMLVCGNCHDEIHSDTAP